MVSNESGSLQAALNLRSVLQCLRLTQMPALFRQSDAFFGCDGGQRVTTLSQELIGTPEVDGLPIDLASGDGETELHLFAVDVDLDPKVLESGIRLLTLLLSARPIDQVELQRLNN